MKVLHVIDNYNIGGIQDFIFSLHKHSKFLHHGRGALGSLAPEMLEHGFTFNPASLKGYDVMVGHTVGGWSYDDTFTEAKNAGLKTVEVMHSPHSSPTNPILVDGFVGVSQEAVNLNPQFKNRIKIYPFANNVSPAKDNSKREYIGRVSRVVPEKCPDVFARIADSLKGYKFILGGDGSMLDYIKSKKIPNLEFSGMVRDFNGFFAKLKIFAFPTRDECCSVSVAMAQAAMVPAVVQDIAPLRETTGGYALFANSMTDFCFKIVNLWDCPIEAHELACEAFVWAEKNFSPAVVCENWENYLTEIVG